MASTLVAPKDPAAARRPRAVPAPPPSADDSVPLQRHPLLLVGRVLLALAVFGVLFAAFELTVTDLLEQRSQATLYSEFKDSIVTTRLDGQTVSPAEGSAVAIIDIPSLGVHDAVVEGTTPGDLKAGPGHLVSTPLPGEFGNVVIAGHRTTYGAPFGALDNATVGDVIHVTSGQGVSTYIVSDIERVRAGQTDPLLATAESRLTLITSDPAIVASGRLVVIAKLQGLPIDVGNRSPALVGTADLGLAGDATGLALGLVWAELLVLALWLAWRSRHRWPTSVLYAVTAPVVAALALLAFSSLDLILPGTL